jgi:hypothetical protein
LYRALFVTTFSWWSFLWRGLFLALLLATRERTVSDRESGAGDGATAKPAAVLLAGGPRALVVSDGRPVKIWECEKDSEAASGHLVGASRAGGLASWARIQAVGHRSKSETPQWV